jgi:hypothetical protein
VPDLQAAIRKIPAQNDHVMVLDHLDLTSFGVGYAVINRRIPSGWSQSSPSGSFPPGDLKDNSTSCEGLGCGFGGAE